MFIGLLFLYSLLKSKDYFREMARKNYKIDKELSKRYKTEALPGEKFSKYKRRVKKNLG